MDMKLSFVPVCKKSSFDEWVDTVFKNHKKLSFNMASYINILSGQKFINFKWKMQKRSILESFLYLKLRVKQCYKTAQFY